MPSSDMNTPVDSVDRGRSHVLVWAPVFLGTGIGVYFSLPWEPSAAVGAAALLGGVAAVLACPPASWARLVAWGLLAAAVGFAAAQLRTWLVDAPAIAERIGPLTVEGRVVVHEPLPKGSRVILDRLHITRLDANRVPERVRLRLNGEQPVLRPGQWVRLRAVLSPPPPPSAPGAFDFQRQAFFQRLGGVGFALGEVRLLSDEAAPTWRDRIAIAIESLRQDIDHRIRGQIPGDTGATVSAMVTGVRGGISEKAMEEVRDSGLAHLLAISGLHIGLAAGLLFALARGLLALAPAIALRYPIKKWAAVIACAGAACYAVVAGGAVPTQRAFLMIAIALVAVLYDRRALSIRLVAVAAAGILLVAPEDLLGASFQMSFAAVTALIAFYEAARSWRLFRRGAGLPGRITAYACGVALTTVIATLATAPYSAYHFNRLAAYGLAANMVAVPVTALWIVPWTLLVLAGLPFGLQAVPVAMMGRGVDVVLAVAHEVASWPGSSELVPAAPVAALVAVTLGGLWICLTSGRWRLGGIAGVVAALALTAIERPPDVLVDDTGRLFAVRTADGSLIMSSRRVGRFDREIWLRRDGLEEDDGKISWPWEGVTAGGPLACDSTGCVYRTAGRMVAFPRLQDAAAEDCWRADVVVNGMPMTLRCGTAAAISRADLARNGAHALWLDADRIRIESVNGGRGDRPWVVRPPTRRLLSTSATGRSAVPEP